MPLDIFTSPHIYGKHVKFISFAYLSLYFVADNQSVEKGTYFHVHIYKYLGTCFLVLPSRHLLFAKELCLPMFLTPIVMGHQVPKNFVPLAQNF
jgi:hypothetical protein